MALLKKHNPLFFKETAYIAGSWNGFLLFHSAVAQSVCSSKNTGLADISTEVCEPVVKPSCSSKMAGPANLPTEVCEPVDKVPCTSKNADPVDPSTQVCELVAESSCSSKTEC